jgi:hypothetical protein
MLADALIAFADVPLAWLGFRVLWVGSLGRVEKQTVADLLLLRKVRSGRSFAMWLLAVVVGAAAVAAFLGTLIWLGPFASVHEWRN